MSRIVMLLIRESHRLEGFLYATHKSILHLQWEQFEKEQGGGGLLTYFFCGGIFIYSLFNLKPYLKIASTAEGSEFESR
jgi:hypothetical protein